MATRTAPPAAPSGTCKTHSPVPSTTMRFLPPLLGAVSSSDGQPGCCCGALPLLAAWKGGGGVETCGRAAEGAHQPRWQSQRPVQGQRRRRVGTPTQSQRTRRLSPGLTSPPPCPAAASHATGSSASRLQRRPTGVLACGTRRQRRRRQTHLLRRRCRGAALQPGGACSTGAGCLGVQGPARRRAIQAASAASHSRHCEGAPGNVRQALGVRRQRLGGAPPLLQGLHREGRAVAQLPVGAGSRGCANALGKRKRPAICPSCPARALLSSGLRVPGAP